MPIYKGSKLINVLRRSSNIGKVYHGKTLVFQILPANTVLFSTRNAGTYSFTIPTSQNYRINVVAGGHGGYSLVDGTLTGPGAGGSGTNQSTTIVGATGQSGWVEIRTI